MIETLLSYGITALEVVAPGWLLEVAPYWVVVAYMAVQGMLYALYDIFIAEAHSGGQSLFYAFLVIFIPFGFTAYIALHHWIEAELELIQQWEEQILG